MSKKDYSIMIIECDHCLLELTRQANQDNSNVYVFVSVWYQTRYRKNFVPLK